jgi:hypothetical protein
VASHFLRSISLVLITIAFAGCSSTIGLSHRFTFSGGAYAGKPSKVLLRLADNPVRSVALADSGTSLNAIMLQEGIFQLQPGLVVANLPANLPLSKCLVRITPANSGVPNSLVFPLAMAQTGPMSGLILSNGDMVEIVQYSQLLPEKDPKQTGLFTFQRGGRPPIQENISEKPYYVDDLFDDWNPEAAAKFGPLPNYQLGEIVSITRFVGPGTLVTFVLPSDEKYFAGRTGLVRNVKDLLNIYDKQHVLFDTELHPGDVVTIGTIDEIPGALLALTATIQRVLDQSRAAVAKNK